MTSQTMQETEFVNPLLRTRGAGVSSTLRDWDSWKASWDEEMDRENPKAEVLIGLLHFIFNIRGAYYPAVALLLEVADGYSSYGYLAGDGRECRIRINDERTGEWNPRREVARKAWRLLCDNFFRDSRERLDVVTSWVGAVTDRGIFQRLLWFFDPERTGIHNIPQGIHQNRYDEVALKFLRELVPFTWFFTHFGKYEREMDQEIQQMFREARPKLMEIIEAIHGLDFLLRIELRHAFQPEHAIDSATLAKLEELAMKPYHRYDRGRHEDVTPSTLGEAAWAGSHAAQVLLVLRSNTKEHERQRRIAEARRQAEAAERELAKLSGNK